MSSSLVTITRDDDNDSPMMDDFPCELHRLADLAIMVMWLDDAQRAKKGKSKAVSEDEDEEEEQVYQSPRKTRSWVRHPQQHYDQNPNGASTSSTSLCLTDTRSRKRRALEMPDRKISKSKLKKANIAPFPPAAARETPEWLVQVMRDMNGSQDPRLIFERSLSTSDVNTDLSRLLIPFNMLTRNDFLTTAESLVIERDKCLSTCLVNKLSENWVLWLTRWPMKKKSGNRTLNYALNRGWNDFVKDNGLKADDEISLWSFRNGGVLCFALEHRPKSSI